MALPPEKSRKGTLSRKKKSSLLTPTERTSSKPIQLLLDTELLSNQEPNVPQQTESVKNDPTTSTDGGSLNSLNSLQSIPELSSVLHPLLRRTKMASILFTGESYIDTHLYLSEVAKAFNVISELTQTELDLALPWILQCRVTGFDKGATKSAEEACQYYCRVGLLAMKDWEALSHGNLQEKDSQCTKPESIPFWYDIKPGSVSLWNEMFEFPVENLQEKVILIEVWSQDCKGGTAVINLSKSTFIGRGALELSNIPMDNRQSIQLTLYSHSKKHTRGKLSLRLCLRQLESEVSSQDAIHKYKLLFKAIVKYESDKDQRGELASSQQGGGHQEGGGAATSHQKPDATMFLPKWTAQLSPRAKQLLLIYATWLNIGDLQRADLELSVLLNYNVKMEAFLALLEEIEAKAGKGESVSSNSEMAVPQASTPGDMWSSELQGTLTELSNYCKNVLEHHLDIIKPKELREVLKILQKMYTLNPFVSNLPSAEQSFHGTLEGCAKSGIEHWLKISAAESQPKTRDHQYRATSLKALSEYCCSMCQQVQELVVGLFKEFGLDYYPIFIQMIGSKLSEVATRYISEETDLRSDSNTASVYYQAFQISRRIQSQASSFEPSLSKELHIWQSHRWYKPLVLSWIEAAKSNCQGRIQKAVELDEVVKVVGEVNYSSSAIDVATFLYQMVKFWKELDWPVVEECFPFALLHLQAICECAAFYVDTCYKELASKNLHDKNGMFSASEQVCTLFNNMAHIKSQLDRLIKEMEVEALCKRMEKDRVQDTVRTLENLKKSTEDDISNKILVAVRQFSKMLAPDITTFIRSIMSSADVNISIEALLEFLSKNLKTFSDYLLDDVFHKVLYCVWTVTITSAQSVLQSGVQSQTDRECRQLSEALQALKEFFNADGNGLTMKRLESNEYKALASEVEVKCLPAKDLIVKCCLELVEQQPAITVPSPIGELSFSVTYLEDKSVLEVNVLNAKLVTGDKNKKDGSADTFVQVWLLPQVMFPECTKGSYKTDLKKGALNPVYYKELQLTARLEDLRRDGAILVLAVYFTDMKHIAGLCVAPCKDVPVLQNGSGRQKFTLPLFLLKMQNSGPLKELMVRQTLQDQEMVDFYNHLVKKLYASMVG